MELIDEIEPYLAGQIRITSVPNHLKVLCALHFYAQGNYQKAVGQDFLLGMSQPMVSRCINTISEILSNHIGRRYIKFPSTVEEKRLLTQGFMNKFNFPGVIGCIDCTHIAIVAPPLEHPVHPGIAYLNRKGFHSINCQLICDSNLKILNCNARYPGSTHDSAIWTMSNVIQHMEQTYGNGERGFWLLGDSGYPLQPWLLTPIEGAQQNTPEGRYTFSHSSVRNCVERCNGVLKMRFRCLLKHRVLHYTPVKAAEIINACCVLHNILVSHNIEVELVEEDELVNDMEENVQENNLPLDDRLVAGRRIRNQLIRNYFN
ncbi:putative nuclease HARBI1 [Diabrotica virgifera virgifera]|uniref:Putative nuclease HARBI1 n=1 Tax=Diabrotica virgifera virgifera TaxID=50390 RepID=A0ABM5KYP7_DIAVI|nr:putative nuclease HARBI1 [Diabrotica virgifera virgifera]